MEKLDHFYHNQVDYFMQLMMHIYMVVHLQLVLLIVQELYQEDQKEKLEFGKLENKLKL
ncbi:unnamed protein product [Paramecium sonneborni]|uniref:Uncharacterized protein n=1 Tax=Paramecium sonneborni TaxID=65129 RepID=A0A8S1Q0A6_9CILI|nr:unnamed protein product [Paramecium sonneborni]